MYLCITLKIENIIKIFILMLSCVCADIAVLAFFLSKSDCICMMGELSKVQII